MTQYLRNKKILLGVTGSIAAYKSADLVRRLREVGAIVRVAMTENAKRFITPLTMQAVSGFPVHDDLFDVHAEAAMGHIELARWADIILIAPATADFIANLVTGRAPDLLATICIATKAPIALAPAMNQGMWKNEFTKENLQQLLNHPQFHFLEPGLGSQACGDVGPGRMMEPTEIIQSIHAIFATGLLAGKTILMTAGPTREAIDPIRYVTNGSSGKMGYAIAEAATEAGAAVTLISGPVALPKPLHVAEIVAVDSALAMHEAVMSRVANVDIFIAVAAVVDYRCEKIAAQKIHKTNTPITLTLIPNPDIVRDVGLLKQKPFIVGFAAETENVEAQAQTKRKQKNMDVIIANQISATQGMGSDENQVVALTAHEEIFFPLTSKGKLARELIAFIASVYQRENNKSTKV